MSTKVTLFSTTLVKLPRKKSRVEKSYDMVDECAHGLRTPKESINQRNLKNRANVADKICFGQTLKLGI